MQKV